MMVGDINAEYVNVDILFFRKNGVSLDLPVE